MIVSDLQCQSIFLPWLQTALEDSTVNSYQLDRLIARRGPHDLRILVNNNEQEGFACCFQLEKSTGNDACFQMGEWQLAYRNPEFESKLAINDVLGELGIKAIAKFLDTEIVKSTLHSYAPERRAVIEFLLANDTRVIGKLYRPGTAKQAYDLAYQLSKTDLSDSLVTPLACIEELDLILWQEAEGELLSDLYGNNRYIDGLTSTGKALRNLHGQSVENQAKPVTLQSELAVVDKQIRRLTGIFEEEKLNPLLDLHQTLESSCESLAETDNKLIHGDFHDRQVIIRDGNPVILDLDGVDLGDPAIDVGNFLAHIDFRVAFELSDQSPEKFHGAFRQGYKIPETDHRVQLAHAISLLRNAALYLLIPERHQLLTSACRKIIAKL